MDERIQARIDELNAAIEKLPIRVASEGRITMRDSLIKLRDDVLADPEAWLAKQGEQE